MSEIRTMGQFIDQLAEFLDSTGKLYLEWANKHTEVAELAKFREAPFDTECVKILVGGLLAEMQDYIMNAAPEELYESELSDAHKALQQLESFALANGLTIRADQPITYSEIGVAAGVIEVKKGMIKLTALGEQVAEKVKINQS